MMIIITTEFCDACLSSAVYIHDFIRSYFYDFFLVDLTTYDSAKHFILRNTSLQDNYVTHSLAR